MGGDSAGQSDPIGGDQADGRTGAQGRAGRQGDEVVITGAQIKAARVLLGWSVRDLARRASIEIADVQDVEDASKPPKRHIASIRDALEDAGIQFIDSVGVELRPVLPNEVGQETAVPAAKGKR